jgi:4-hydroxy-3-polyprenylbenzoate decarboxylase
MFARVASARAVGGDIGHRSGPAARQGTSMRKLIVGMTGATGAILGIRLLQAMRAAGVETHLVLSKWAQSTIEHESGLAVNDVRELASVVHAIADMGATISSGSFATDGMVIAPCSMRTLAAIAHGTGENLIHRAADVVLKERRRLVLVTRETPLSDIHLDNMLKLSRAGALIMPPVPAFYNHPKSLDDMVDHIVARILDQFGIEAAFARRWDGRMRGAKRSARSERSD